MFGGGKNGDVRVRRALDSQDIKYELDGDGDFRIVYRFSDGRTQLGFINSNTESFAGVEIRDVWSVGLSGKGQLTAEVANALLAKNSRYKVGGWLTSQRNGDILAVFKVAVSADASAQELVTILEQVLIQADEVEKEFTGVDKH